MALCDACLGIDIRGLLLSYLQELKEKNLGPLWEGPIRIAPDVRDPYVTAQSFQIHHSILTCNERSETCELCALFWEGWLIYCSRQAGDRELEANKLEDSPVRLYLLEGLHGTKSRPRFKVCFGNAAPIWTDAGSSDGPIWFEARTIHDQLPLLREDAEAWNELELLKESSKHSNCDDCLSLAKGWLHTCLQNHPSCHRNNEQAMPLPTRVIDVGNDEVRPSLHLSHGEIGIWIALSYCWGGETKFKLTQDTMHAWQNGIVLEDFPGTLRDGITIARALNIRYIWIDALCIFQDSKADWEIEAPKMGQYYTNATLTVVAGTSGSVNDGIFHQRQRRKNSWNLPWNNAIVKGESSEATVVFRTYNRSEKLDDLPTPENCFWATRGWTMQEDLLSWRTLSYLENQIIWQCSTSKCYEIGGAARQGPRENFFRFKQIMTYQPSVNAIGKANIYDAWYLALSVYSARTLTYLLDRLPAISGIAEKIAVATGDRYYAGIFEKDILYGLLWVPSKGVVAKSNIELAPQSVCFTGPSWSWVSFNRGITNRVRLAKRESIRDVAQVEKVALDYVSSNLFGAVTGGTLRIKGPCYAADSFTTAGSEESNMASPNFWIFLIQSIERSSEFQARHIAYKGQQLLAMQILNHSQDDERRWRTVFELLIFETVDDDRGHSYHRRVSQLSVHPKEWKYSPTEPVSEEEHAAWVEMSSVLWPVRTVTII